MCKLILEKQVDDLIDIFFEIVNLLQQQCVGGATNLHSTGTEENSFLICENIFFDSFTT